MATGGSLYLLFGLRVRIAAFTLKAVYEVILVLKVSNLELGAIVNKNLKY